MGKKIYFEEVPKKVAKLARELLGADKNIPVIYGRGIRIFPVNDDDIKLGKKLDQRACAIARSVKAITGHECIIGFRKVILQAKDSKGNDVIELLQHSISSHRFVKNFDAEKYVRANGATFTPYPQSWMPSWRRRVAKERMKRIKAGNYHPRPYVKRNLVKPGLHRAELPNI